MVGRLKMANKKRKKNGQGKKKQRRVAKPEQSPEIRQPIIEESQVVESQEIAEDQSERFVYVNEIANRLGVTATAVRQWGRQGKINLRKLFGTEGMYGMPESQLLRIINGECEG